MDVLLAILLYLGLLSTQHSYTLDNVNSIATTNSGTVVMVSADSTQMRTVTEVYLTQISSIEIVDRGTGN
ncbi:MAG: hypothetical protein JSS89_04190 [Bacteroidetes bacterium]|nr:hypothetical protein [Bacteroidota bacterium]